MLSENLRYLPVNWFDGMSINKDHFIAQENAIHEKIIRLTGFVVNQYGYGLLPAGRNEQMAFNVDVTPSGFLNVRIKNMKAITLGGLMIDISQHTSDEVIFSQQIDLPADQSKADFLVMVWANPYSRVPYGHADPEENPPRKPYCIPLFQLNVVAVSDMGQGEIGLYHIPVGKITCVSGEWKVCDNYVPPCTSVDCYPILSDFYYRVNRNLETLEKYLIRIVQKVRMKNQQNALAVTIRDLSMEMLRFLNMALPRFQVCLKVDPPVNFFELIAAFSRTISNSIETWQGNGKEELLNYLTEWCHLNQGKMDQTLAELSKVSYAHHDISSAIGRSNDFFEIIMPLFRGLSELDYIGKRLDTNLFVVEEENNFSVDNNENNKSGWFKRK